MLLRGYPILKWEGAVMKRQDRKLLHEILIVLVIKLILLYGIWSLWIADRHVAVTPHSTMDHLLAPH